ncbi:MAG: AbrB/MazE/SpoVT family DNA-binding domain-containing protein [Gemmatimonadaceae bacterium]|nr:AbrB/MazE/SpoVT family DNA-binding domain-containing protein [Acetobacteraceae bacterium]
MTKVILEQVGELVGFAFPADVQRTMGLEAGQQLTLSLRDGQVILIKQNDRVQRQLVTARRVLHEQAAVLQGLADYDRA